MTIRPLDVQCNGCGTKGKGFIQTLPLDGVSNTLGWISPPRNWFITHCLVENAHNDRDEIVLGKTPLAFLIFEICGKLGRSQMSEEN